MYAAARITTSETPFLLTMLMRAEGALLEELDDRRPSPKGTV